MTPVHTAAAPQCRAGRGCGRPDPPLRQGEQQDIGSSSLGQPGSSASLSRCPQSVHALCHPGHPHQSPCTSCPATHAPQEFLYTDPALALEYYMLAAEALGGSVQARQSGMLSLHGLPPEQFAALLATCNLGLGPSGGAAAGPPTKPWCVTAQAMNERRLKTLSPSSPLPAG